MTLTPLKSHYEISELLAAANRRLAAMTPEQQAAHWKAQRESWVRGQVAMGNDADEAKARAMLEEGERK